MGCKAAKLAGAALLLATLAGCGGDDSATGSSGGPTTSPTPAPSPSPTPTPTPAAFEPVAGSLFGSPLYNSSFAIMGHAWLTPLPSPTAPGPLENVSEANTFGASYDAATGTYRLDAGIAGSGTLYQVLAANPSGTYVAVVADSKPTVGASSELRIFPAGTASAAFSYVAVAQPELQTDTQLYYGAFGVAQPSLPGDIPASGVSRYEGALYGNFARDPWGTGLTGKTALDLDFTTGTIAGSLTAELWCFMGCSATGVVYTLGNTHRTGPNTFSGDIMTAGAPSAGKFTALLAGPGAAEMLLSVEFPYSNNQYGEAWLTYGGVVVVRKTS